MISQSENNIKRSALQFLKMYYKHRPRSSSSETSVYIDQKTSSGIIADGLLSFQKEGGEQFLASVEATSFDSRDEVKYKFLRTSIFWDCVMCASAISAVVILFGHFYHLFSFQTNRWLLAGFIASVFLFGYFFTQWLLSPRSKYRYIYALQQFKKYHADEQWVAIGDNVFISEQDPMYEELKRQCIKNGFGLLNVDKQLETHLVIAPSREELFGSKRKMLQFFSNENSNEKTTTKKWMSWWEKLKNTIQGTVNSESLSRYQRKAYFPMLVSGLMFGLIAFVAYEDLRQKDIVYVDEENFDEQLMKERKKLKKENDFELDEKIVEKNISPIGKKVPDAYIAVVEPNKRNDLVIQPADSNDHLTAKGGSGKKEVFIKNGNSNIAYNCARLYNFKGKKFIVQDGEFTTQIEAEKRLDLLRKKGFDANLMWLNCFSESENYTIYIDWIFNEMNEATEAGKKYRKQLKKLKIKERKLSIRTLER